MIMKHLLLTLLAILVADDVLSQPATPTAPATNTPPRRAGRGTPNSNDVFYTLGPDSRPRDGVPEGKFAGPKIIPSDVFPGTTHKYDVYVPAQYDPAVPVAVMIFNDGPAMSRTAATTIAAPAIPTTTGSSRTSGSKTRWPAKATT